MQIMLPQGTVDLSRASFVAHTGSEARLTAREVAMMRYLASRAGEDVSRDELLEEIWGYHELSMSRAVDTAVARLRRKIEADPRTPEALFTVHGEGYRLVLAAATAPVVVCSQERRVLDLGDRVVDLAAGLVRGEGEAVQLTTLERRLLEHLAAKPGAILEAGRLARLAGVSGGKPALANAMYRLRAKIEADPTEPRWVVGVRGQGYRLDLNPGAARPSLSALRETLWTVADQLGRLLGLEDCVVYTRDGNHLVQAAAFGAKAPARGDIESPLALRIGEGIVGNAARTGHVQLVHDVTADRRYVSDLQPGRSELAVPILHAGEVVGVLDSESRQVAAYSEQHRAIFDSLAQVLAAAARDLAMAA